MNWITMQWCIDCQSRVLDIGEGICDCIPYGYKEEEEE